MWYSYRGGLRRKPVSAITLHVLSWRAAGGSRRHAAYPVAVQCSVFGEGLPCLSASGGCMCFPNRQQMR
jgi:hypothetical protein